MYVILPIIIILAVVIGIGIYVAIIYSRRRNERFATFAEGLGMEVVKGRWTEQPKLRGSYSGRRVQIQDIAHSTGKSVYFTYKITYESAVQSRERVSVNISRHGLITNFFLNIGKIFGYKTVPFDNFEFDSCAIVRSSNADFARALLDVELQQDIQNLRKGWIVIRGDKITFEEYGQAQDNENHVREVLPLLDKIEGKLNRLGSSYVDTYEKQGLSSF